jgi:hypothetical protein
VNRAGHAATETPGVVGVRVRDDDRARAKVVEPAEPIFATVDDDAPAAMQYEEDRMHPVAWRPDVDVAARSEKEALHLGLRHKRVRIFSERSLSHRSEE